MLGEGAPPSLVGTSLSDYSRLGGSVSQVGSNIGSEFKDLGT